MEDTYLVGILYRGKPVGDRYGRPCGREPVAGFLHDLIGLGVQCLWGIAMDKYMRVLDYHRGYGDLMLLPS